MYDTDPSWPHFLDLLDSDPDNAFVEFYLFSDVVLTAQPPQPMRSIEKEERHDLISDIKYFCVRDNFRVLRSYVNKGNSFAGWFYVIAHNKTMDYLRKAGRLPDTIPIHQSTSGKSGLENVLATASPNPGDNFEFSELSEIVARCLSVIGDKCRFLLELSADELTPQEIVVLLRLDFGQNKKVATDIRDCRRKLKKLLAESGINIREYFPKKHS